MFLRTQYKLALFISRVVRRIVLFMVLEFLSPLYPVHFFHPGLRSSVLKSIPPGGMSVAGLAAYEVIKGMWSIRNDQPRK